MQVGPPKHDTNRLRNVLADTYDNIFTQFFTLVRSDISPLKSIILPMLGTGSYRVPLEMSAETLFLSLYHLNQTLQNDTCTGTKIQKT